MREKQGQIGLGVSIFDTVVFAKEMEKTIWIGGVLIINKVD
ncbi:MAG: hypothetical protein ACFE75_06960 [Candidatus Hodarchaeota archaeon]